MQEEEKTKFNMREDMKKQASILKDFLGQNNTTISRSSCLQAIAKIHGFESWNRLSAILNEQEGEE